MKFELRPSEAIYAFCGWLTTREEVICMSSRSDSAVIVDLIKQFCSSQEFELPRNGFQDYLKPYPKEGKEG